MIDIEKLQADIEAAQKNMSDMIGRVCATLVRELNACKPEAPAWKPEDLIGNLVRAWDNEGDEKQIGIFRAIDSSCSLTPYLVYGLAFEHFCHIEPLTEAEALALVWRKPGALICQNCHKETTVELAGPPGSQHYGVCSLCKARWNPPVTEKPKTRYDDCPECGSKYPNAHAIDCKTGQAFQ